MCRVKRCELFWKTCLSEILQMLAKEVFIVSTVLTTSKHRWYHSLTFIITAVFLDCLQTVILLVIPYFHWVNVDKAWSFTHSYPYLVQGECTRLKFRKWKNCFSGWENGIVRSFFTFTLKVLTEWLDLIPVPQIKNKVTLRPFP